MATQAVRAWVLESGNYVDILFDEVIDVSEGGTAASITFSPDNGSTESSPTAITMVSTVDGKYIRFTVDNQATLEGWSDAQKKTTELKLLAAAFTDINGSGTGATAYTDNIRVHFCNEASMSDTNDYHADSDTIYLPDQVSITQDVTAYDTAQSTRVFNYVGRGSGTVIAGDLNLGPVANCSASDPLELNISQCTIDGDLLFADQSSAQYEDGTSNTGADYIHDDGVYVATAFTPSTSKTAVSLKLRVKKNTLASTIEDGTTYTGTDLTSTGDNIIRASKFTSNSDVQYLKSVTFRAKYVSVIPTITNAVLYSDDGGGTSKPLTLLATSANGASLASGFQLITYTFTTPVKLTPSTVYWIGLKRNNGAYTIDADATGTDTQAVYDSSTGLWTTSNNHLYYNILAYTESDTALSSSYLTAGIYSNNTDEPGEVLSALVNGSTLANIGSTYETVTFGITNTNLTAGTQYWIVAYFPYLEALDFDAQTSTGDIEYSDTAVTGSWTNVTGTLYFEIDKDLPAKQYLTGKMQNVTWEGNFKYSSSYYFAGLLPTNAGKTFTVDRCNIILPAIHNAASIENQWNLINSSVSPGLGVATLFTGSGFNGVCSYCNFSSGAALGFTGTVYNCYIGGTATNVTNDTTNESGLTVSALSDTQGASWSSGSTLNAGKTYTQTIGADDSGERAIGVPKGAMVGVGAFSTKPATSITPTAAVATTNTITLTVASGSISAGDTITVIVNNVEDENGTKIPQNSTASAVVTA